MVYNRYEMTKSQFQFSEAECPEPRAQRGVERQFFVYLLECCDGNTYCGSTTHLKRSIHEHSMETAALWTAKRLPIRLVYFEIHESLLLAHKRERQIKGWRVEKKINLITGKWKKM